VSVRAGEHFVVTPTGGVFEELEVHQMVVVDRNGETVEGDYAPTSELGLHLGVYERVEAAGAVVHTHAPLATALACVLDEVPAVHYQMLALGGPVPVVPYATFGTAELAGSVGSALEQRPAVLMQNHGATNWGNDLDTAVELALLLEWACTLYWHARMIGEPSTLSEDQLQGVVAAVQERGYGRLKKE
jgi:L-fuculose-phosphate aldolase